MAHGAASAMTGPLTRPAVDWAFNQVGGVERDSDLYRNGHMIGDGVVSGSLILVAPGSGGGGPEAEEGTVTLYRAVKKPELDNILETSTYRVAEGQTEGKYFFERAEDAADFGDKMFRLKPNEGAYTVTSVQVDRAVIQASTPIKAAGEGPGYFVPANKLPLGPVKVH